MKKTKLSLYSIRKSLTRAAEILDILSHSANGNLKVKEAVDWRTASDIHTQLVRLGLLVEELEQALEKWNWNRTV